MRGTGGGAGPYVKPAPGAVLHGNLKVPVIHARPWKAPGATKAKPAADHASQAITYTRTDSQRAQGIVTAGTIWSPGPNPRSVWVSPDDLPRSFANMALVTVPADGSQPWAQLSHADTRAMTNLALAA